MIFRKSRRREIPWELEPSIYSVMATNKKFGPVEDIDLPDEDRVALSEKVLWAAGAADGVFTHHMNLQMNEKLAEKTIKYLLAISKLNLHEDKLNLYNLLKQNHVISFLDRLLDKVPEEDIDLEALHKIARWLATETPDREPVKLGIGLLGCMNTGSDTENLDIIRLLGLHNEFTLYAAVALDNRSDSPLDELWSMAKEVHGWGRIHVVERICKQQLLPFHIQDWLLREGFKNSIMDEYLACICATAGNLKERLHQNEPDKELLDSAGQIIAALLQESSALPDVDDYPDSCTVLRKYIEHIQDGALTEERKELLQCIRTFLNGKDGNVKSRTDAVSDKTNIGVQTLPAGEKERVITSFPYSDQSTTLKWERRYTKDWSPELRFHLLKVVESKLAEN